MWGSSVEQPYVSSYFSGKFTSSYDYEAESTTFLDMEVRIVNGRIETDLYRKKTDKIRYLTTQPTFLTTSRTPWQTLLRKCLITLYIMAAGPLWYHAPSEIQSWDLRAYLYLRAIISDHWPNTAG